MRRGAIYWVNLGPTSPPEFGKTRPGLVVSSTVHNEVLDSVVIVPLSTKPGDIWPLRVALGAVADTDAWAVLPGIRQVSKKRVGEPLEILSDTLLQDIDRAIAAYLSE